MCIFEVSKTLVAYMCWKKMKTLKRNYIAPFVLDSLDRSSRVQWHLAYKFILSIIETDSGTNWTT